MSEDKKSNINRSSNPASHENLTKAKFEEGLSSRSKRLIRDERRVDSKSDALASAITKKPGVSKMGAAVRSDKPSEAKQIAKETLSSISPAAGKADHNCEYCDRIDNWKTFRKSVDLDKSYSKKPNPADVMDQGVWSDIPSDKPFTYSVTKRTGLQNEPACHIHATDGKHEFMGLFSLLGGEIQENVLSRQGQFPPKDPRHKLLQKKARAVATKHLLSKNDVEGSKLNKAKEYVPQKKVQSLSIQAPTMPKVNTPSVSKPADPNLKIRTPGPLNKSEPSEDSNNQMASSQLQEIRHHLGEIFEHFNVQGNIPDWLKSKLTIANDYLATMSHYLDSNPELHKALSLGSSDVNPEPVSKSEDLTKGKNKREQRSLVYGNDANGSRLSPKRMKMMQNIKRFMGSRHGLNLEIASGKRDESGTLKNESSLETQPFDVLSEKGLKQEKARQQKINQKNQDRASSGEKEVKRLDKKPDWRSGDFETQPSPDAAVHEMAHFYLQPEGRTLSNMQTEMDKEVGNSQRKYGYMQQKKTAGEIQPMSLENKIRRRLGIPATKPHKNAHPISQHDRPVEQSVDGTGPRFTRGIKPGKNPKSVDFDRSSRLLSPENAAQFDKIDRGEVVFNKEKGWEKGTSPNAKINQRAREASKDSTRKDSKTLMRSEED